MAPERLTHFFWHKLSWLITHFFRYTAVDHRQTSFTILYLQWCCLDICSLPGVGPGLNQVEQAQIDPGLIGDFVPWGWVFLRQTYGEVLPLDRIVLPFWSRIKFIIWVCSPTWLYHGILRLLSCLPWDPAHLFIHRSHKLCLAVYYIQWTKGVTTLAYLPHHLNLIRHIWIQFLKLLF